MTNFDSQFESVLRRAEEISADGSELLQDRPDLDSIVTAAEEAGMSREAVMIAIRERIAEMAAGIAPGDLAFARSPDGHWYPATCVEHARGRTKVRYLSGGEGTLDPGDVRPFEVSPGMVIQAFSQHYKTWVNAKVERFNPDSRSITARCWYEEDIFALERIRLKGKRAKTSLLDKSNVILMTAIVGGAGALIGALVTFFVTR